MMSAQEMEAEINRLVDTKYIGEVDEILQRIVDPRDRATVVGAALARSVDRGRDEGRRKARQEIRERLGL